MSLNTGMKTGSTLLVVLVGTIQLCYYSFRGPAAQSGTLGAHDLQHAWRRWECVGPTQFTWCVEYKGTTNLSTAQRRAPVVNRSCVSSICFCDRWDRRNTFPILSQCFRDSTGDKSVHPSVPIPWCRKSIFTFAAPTQIPPKVLRSRRFVLYLHEYWSDSSFLGCVGTARISTLGGICVGAAKVKVLFRHHRTQQRPYTGLCGVLPHIQRGDHCAAGAMFVCTAWEVGCVSLDIREQNLKIQGADLRHRGGKVTFPPPEQDPAISLDLSRISWRGVTQNDRRGQARHFRGLNAVLLDTWACWSPISNWSWF